jgi:Histidinol dehydrogenase
MAIKIKFGDPDFKDSIDLLVGARQEIDKNVYDTVREILADIRSRGDQALIEYTEKF